jgi:hypothetical protein
MIERDPSIPKLIGPELAAIMAAATPTFGPCDTCAQLTTGPRCFDCFRDADAILAGQQTLAASVPHEFAWASLGSPLLVQRVRGGVQAVERARLSVSASRVILMGPSGSGKTSLAVAMARAWVDHHKQAATFVLATDLASARSRSRLGSEADEVHQAIGAPLLVLDDLGTDRDIATSAVTEVIFKRHAESRATWITTAMNIDEMRAKYGDGVARRVFERARIISLVETP